VNFLVILKISKSHAFTLVSTNIKQWCGCFFFFFFFFFFGTYTADLPELFYNTGNLTINKPGIYATIHYLKYFFFNFEIIHHWLWSSERQNSFKKISTIADLNREGIWLDIMKKFWESCTPESPDFWKSHIPLWHNCHLATWNFWP